MKILSSFMAANVEGADRISFTYSEIDDTTGKILSQPKKESFVVVDSGLAEQIEAVRDYIRKHKLTAE